ncbi:F-box associated interaction domain-containing protein [Artemisia annua]|uniref:F-box associated interaction domain-containing protein n=1 Tax=Artemisia annua TaxID=35608 RepID=A0A2U1PBP9_ARTAN|nr:F-box associated interaction domain-containing protein [Artemisia annua]
MSWQSNFWMALELRNAEIFPNDVYAGEVIEAAKSFAMNELRTLIQREQTWLSKIKKKSKRISNWIPTEIILEIMLKLPVESLLRCKSVCKEWYSLISDQSFIKTHYTLSSTNNINYEHHRLIYNTFEQRNNLKVCPLSNLMFDKSVNNALLLENPLQQTRSQRISIVGSCNGLVCLLVEDDNNLFISNPCTRTSNILPCSKQGAVSWGVSYGFGYDEMTHDYKVVKIRRCKPTWSYWGTMIYSVKAGSWKKIGRFPCAYPSNDVKFLNGALHWGAGDVGSGSWHIVSLDLGKETYGEVLQPEYDEGSKILTLGVWGEWLMKVYEVKDSWTKLLSIPHLNDQNSIPLYVEIHAPLCISNDGKLLLQLGKMLVVYDCINGSCSMIQNFDGFLNACIVVGSLISPFAPLGLGDNNGDEN